MISNLVFYSASQKVIVDFAVIIDNQLRSAHKKQTIEQLRERYSDIVLVECDYAVVQIETSHKSDIEEIEDEHYYDVLGSMMPIRFFKINDIRGFVSGELYSGNIANLYFFRDGKYYYFRDNQFISNEEILAKFKAKED